MCGAAHRPVAMAPGSRNKNRGDGLASGRGRGRGRGAPAAPPAADERRVALHAEVPEIQVGIVLHSDLDEALEPQRAPHPVQDSQSQQGLQGFLSDFDLLVFRVEKFIPSVPDLGFEMGDVEIKPTFRT